MHYRLVRGLFDEYLNRLQVEMSLMQPVSQRRLYREDRIGILEV